jgi:hypothetical protein
MKHILQSDPTQNSHNANGQQPECISAAATATTEA